MLLLSFGGRICRSKEIVGRGVVQSDAIVVVADEYDVTNRARMSDCTRASAKVRAKRASSNAA